MLQNSVVLVRSFILDGVLQPVLDLLPTRERTRVELHRKSQSQLTATDHGELVFFAGIRASKGSNLL